MQANFSSGLRKRLRQYAKEKGWKTFEKVILRLLNFIGIKRKMLTSKSKERLRRIDIIVSSIEGALKRS